MSYTFNCLCKTCGHKFTTRPTGGFKWCAVLCDSCGKNSALPRFAPRPSSGLFHPSKAGNRTWIGANRPEEVSFTDDELAEILANRDSWGKSGDLWEPSEIKRMIAIKGLCHCGGNWERANEVQNVDPLRPNDLVRCPRCQSNEYDYELHDGIVSD